MRRLALRRETLASLSDADLGSVVGAAQTADCRITDIGCPTDPCLTPPPYTGLNCIATEGCA